MYFLIPKPHHQPGDKQAAPTPVTFFDSKGRGQNVNRDFPYRSVVRNSPASAGDAGSMPGLERSHVLWSHSAYEPQLLSPCAPRAHVPRQEKPQQQGAQASQQRGAPSPATRENPHGNKDPPQPKSPSQSIKLLRKTLNEFLIE